MKVPSWMFRISNTRSLLFEPVALSVGNVGEIGGVGEPMVFSSSGVSFGSRISKG